MSTIRIASLAFATLAALASAGPALAQEKITLKYSHVFPAAHWHWTESGKLFQEAVTKATNGRVQFETYHAGQLGKEGTSVMASGLADMALMVPSYEAAKLPLTSVSELPGYYSSACDASAKLWNIIKDGGPLNNAEYKPMGIKVLWVLVLAPYQVMTTSKKVASLADMSGLKLRANGAAMDRTIRELGGVPVRVTSNEFYDALSRGTVDGGLWPIGSTRTVGLDKQFKYTVQGTQLGGGASVYGMRQKVWDGLPADVKTAITQAAADVQKSLCKRMDEMDETETQVLAKERGLVVTKLSKEEAARWTEKVLPTAGVWAKEMDASGRPGTALLKAFADAPTR